MARDKTGLVVFVGATPLIIADATVSEVHQREAKVARHPRETGADIADSYKAMSEEVSVVFIVSETPLGFAPEESRPAAVYQALLDLQSGAQLADLQTALRLYSNCALLTVSAPLAADGRSVTISTSWLSVERVTTQQVEIPESVLRSFIRPSGKTKDKTKDQVGEPSAETSAADAAPDVAAAKRSILKGLVTTVGG